MSVPAFSAWSTCSADMPFGIAATNRSWMPACTIRRLEPVQRWPVEKKLNR